MKKRAKQKNKKGQQTPKPHKQEAQDTYAEILAQPEQPVQIEESELTIQNEQGEEPEVNEQSLIVTDDVDATSLQQLLAAKRAALLAKQQQGKQWKQQLKAGRMVGAQVPKRFNRGG